MNIHPAFLRKDALYMKKWCALALALALCLAMLPMTALAADTTLEIEFVPITEDGFVADTMDGVDAIYDLSGGPLCSELIERYYREVYGVTVLLVTAPVVQSGEGWFEEVDVPQRGDVLYASAEARGSCSHYALCKSVDEEAGTVTLFEQNWTWNGQAGIDRVIPLESCYTYYTLRGASARVDRDDPDDAETRDDAKPSVESWYDADRFDVSSFGTPSGWAQDYVQRAADYGILSGLTSGYQKPVTRGEFARMVVDAAGALTGEYVEGSVDVQAETLGLMFGDGKGNFRLHDTLTRQEAAVICTRLMELIGTAPEADVSLLGQYSDSASVANWAKNGVSVMTQMGLMSGTGTGFSPKTTLTTEQAITLLVRVYETAVWF